MSDTKLVKKIPKELSNTEDFKPTLLMKEFVHTMVRIGSDNVAEIARETQNQNKPMSEAAYYEWKKKEGFGEWMNQYAREVLKGDAWKLNAIGMKNAKRDHKYWETMQKIVGNIEDNKQVNVQVNNFVPLLGGESALNVPKNSSNREDPEIIEED